MAHALVMAMRATSGSEDDAFTAFHRYFPDSPLLIDTYDTVAAAKRLGERINAGELELPGVRLDSGDLVELSKQVRSHLPNVPIFVSGDLDEWEIARLKASGAEINGYGLGTRLVTGSPVNGVYKLVEIDNIPVMKESSGKVTYPGRKQIFRSYDVSVNPKSDRLGLITEAALAGEEPLLQLFIKEGQRLQPPEDLITIRQRTTATVASLPKQVRQLENPISLQVEISTELQQLTQKTKKGVGEEGERVMGKG